MAGDRTDKTDRTDRTLERYKIVRVKRALLKNAPYNPRVISDDAKARLRENLKTVGLLSPIVWNKRTGHIVAGHQRLAAMDALHHGKKDYKVTVAQVDLDPKTEVEQNIFMNNPGGAGGLEPVAPG